MTVEQVVDAYFSAIRERDVEAIRRLFTSDGELITVAGVMRGPDAIAAFYQENAFRFDDLMPRPGPLLVDGNRVAVEITLTMAGRTTAVADVFEIAGDQIRRLGIYMGASTDSGQD